MIWKNALSLRLSLCHIGNRATSSTGKTSTSTRWVTSVALKLKSFSSKGHGSKSGRQRDHRFCNVFSSSNLPKWINDFEYICKWAVFQLCVGWDTYTPQVSLQSGTCLVIVIDDSDFVHSVMFCVISKWTSCINCSDLSDKALASTCEQDLPSAVLATNVWNPKSAISKQAMGEIAAVGRGDWHQLTSININFPEAIWSHVILCMLHAHDSWYSSTLPRYKRVDNGGLLEALALCSSSSILQILCNDCNERWLSCELLVRFSTVDMTPCRWCKPLRKLTSWLVCHSNGKLGWLQCLNAVAADGLRAPHLNLSLDCHRFHKVTMNVQTPTDPLCS